MVFLKEFFKKVDFEKKSADDKTAYPGGKELTKRTIHTTTSYLHILALSVRAL